MSNDSEARIFEGDLYFNGINGVTGKYGMKPMSSGTLARLITGNAEPEDRQALIDENRAEALSQEQLQQAQEAEKKDLAVLKDKHRRQSLLVSAPVKEGVDPTRLDQAGWAVIFPALMEPKRQEAIKEALKPLLDLRRGQAGPLFKSLERGKGYRRGERVDQFFQRQKPEIRSGPADPKQLPFYVLLVGNPEEIPFEFQFQLDVMRGVGRIDFGDDLDAYASYAQSVVQAESGQINVPRRASFFGVATPGDQATLLSAEHLVKPLHQNLLQPTLESEIELKHEWEVEKFVGPGKATKAQLKQLLGGDPQQKPALLFTASHGVEFPFQHQHQVARQGALLCQDWQGPGEEVTPDHYFSGLDVGNADVRGMMALFFACYGAGTPRLDNFALQAFKSRVPITPSGFIGALPQQLLSQGMLAIIGHVERAWGYSFISPGGHLDNQAYVTALRKLLNGEPVGLATDPSFDLRYASLSSNLSVVMEELIFDPDSISEQELAHLWTANNDARNYVIIGDPAVKLMAGGGAGQDIQQPERPVEIETPPTEPEPEVSRPAETSFESEPQIVARPAEMEGNAAPQAYILGGTVTLQPTGGEPAVTPGVPATGGQQQAFGGIFGWGDKDDEEETDARQSLRDTIIEMAQNAAKVAAKVAEETTTLEVVTYTSEDMSKVTKENLKNTANLRAITRIKMDGDVEVCIPQNQDGDVDHALWSVHSDMVKQAQANRTAMLKTVVDTLSMWIKG